MEGKKVLYVAIIGLVAIVLVCVLLAGLIDGFWPWSNDRNMDSNYTGITATTADPTETQDTTQDPTGNTTVDPTADTTVPATTDGNTPTTKPTDPTKPTEGEQEGTKPNQGLNNEIHTNIEIGIDDKDDDDDDDDDFGVIDFDDLMNGNFPTDPTTKPTDPTKPTTKPTDPTKPTTKPTDPTKPTTKPTDPAKPTDPTTKPTENNGGGAIVEEGDLSFEF